MAAVNIGANRSPCSRSSHLTQKTQFRVQLRVVWAGLPRMRFHDLRHGTATILLTQGASLPELMAMLGHSQYGTTMNIYAHVAPELLRSDAEPMQRALGTG